MKRAAIIQMAKRDAHRLAEANTDYGTGAGNRRKLVRAEINGRMNDDIYRDAFFEEYERINYEPIVHKVELKHGVRNVIEKTRKTWFIGKKLYNLWNRNRDIFEDIFRKFAE